MASTPLSPPISEQSALASPRVPGSLVMALGVVTAAFLPLLGMHLFQLWARPHYQFFPLVFIGAGVLAYTRFPCMASLCPGTASVSWSLAGLSWLLLASAELLNSSYLAALAALVLLFAIMYTVGGIALVRSLLPAWLYLWLIMPPPFGLDNSLVLLLQRFTTSCSSALLDQFRVYHMISGNVVDVGDRRLFVAEACAGINSLFSVLACALFYVLYTRMGLVRSLLLIVAAVAWVMLMNVVRVFLIAYLVKRWGIDVADGWQHEMLGYILFAGALVLIWSTDRLLLLLTPVRWQKSSSQNDSWSTNKVETASSGGGANVVLGLKKTWLNSRLVPTAFGLLLLGHLALLLFSASEPAPLLASDSANLDKISKNTLPEKWDGWQREKYTEEQRNPGSAYGEFSKIWIFQTDSQGVTLALDYPFASWHDLTECYRNQGWEVVESSDHEGQDKSAAFYCERKLKKTGLRFAQLFFCEFDQSGHVAQPQRGLSATLRRHESALGRLLLWKQQDDASAEHRQTGSLYQFQLLVESNRPLQASERTALLARFIKGSQFIHQQLFP